MRKGGNVVWAGSPAEGGLVRYVHIAEARLGGRVVRVNTRLGEGDAGAVHLGIIAGLAQGSILHSMAHLTVGTM